MIVESIIAASLFYYGHKKIRPRPTASASGEPKVSRLPDGGFVISGDGEGALRDADFLHPTGIRADIPIVTLDGAAPPVTPSPTPGYGTPGGVISAPPAAPLSPYISTSPIGAHPSPTYSGGTLVAAPVTY